MTGHPESRWPLVAAELGLLALATGSLMTFTRLFEGTTFFWTIAPAVIAAWLTALSLRRLGVAAGVSTLASLALGALALVWYFVPTTTFYGLPTRQSVDAIGELLAVSFGGFADQVAPVPASDGFLITVAALLWLFVTFADASAIRFHATVQAVLPYVALVVASGVLARATGRLEAALAFTGGLAVYVVTQRIWHASRSGWRPGDARAGVRATTATAVGIAAVALLLSVIVAPLLPGDEQAVVDIRSLGRGAGPRTVVSPYVGVTSLLGERSDELMFTVRADTPAYWRLTALEQYDTERGIWTSRGTYRSTDGALGETVDGATSLEQEVELAGLGGLWLPAAFEAEAVDSGIPVGFDEASSSLIARDDANVSGTSYRVRSSLRTSIGPQPSSDDSTRPEPVPGSAEVSPAVSDVAREVAGGIADPFERAIRLQDYLRGPGAVYDTAVDYRSEPDPVAAFLATRRGFCQQFASTFALMARAVGLASRVGVGFTPGDPVAESPGRFAVRGRHAHAWPEVDIPGVGWVAFEPTPGRGDPSAVAYTGVAPGQAAPPEEEAAPTSTAPTTVAESAPVTTEPSFDASAGSVPEVPERVGTDVGPPAWMVPVIALVVVAAAAIIARRWRRRRRRQRILRDPGLGPVAVAWNTATDALRTIGFVARPDETPMEFAGRMRTEPGASELSDLARDLTALARIETTRRYCSRPVSDDDLELAGQLARHIGAAAHEQLDRRSRLLERVR